MHAFRALAMTGMIAGAKEELEKMTAKQVDDLIEESKKAKNKDHVIFESREDYNYQLGNATLIIELDENIIKHFLRTKPGLNELRRPH